jgi:pilus assembly protein CpaF
MSDLGIELSVIETIRDKVCEGIDISKEYSDEEFLALIEDRVFNLSEKAYLNSAAKKKLIDGIFNSKRRYDVLQPLLEDPSITEIMVNGPDTVFIERQGQIVRTGIAFESEEKLYNIINSIVSKVNRVVNESSPVVDARLTDGSRVNAVLKPVALNGPVLTIRKFSDKPLTIEQLTALGSTTGEAAVFLEKMVKAKYNIFISGGTGSGKTTF